MGVASSSLRGLSVRGGGVSNLAESLASCASVLMRFCGRGEAGLVLIDADVAAQGSLRAIVKVGGILAVIFGLCSS